MPIIEEVGDATGSGFITASSRYVNSTAITYGDIKILTLEIYKRVISPVTSQDRFTVITPGTEFRPDVVSQQSYGTPEFWWRIMQDNKIFDIFDFKAGLNIRIPGALL